MTLAYDVKQLYPTECKIGRYIVSRVRQEFGVNLPEGEIACIAMNIVNAKASEGAQAATESACTFEMLLDDVTGIVERSFRTIINREGFAYSRFATHIRYLYQRIQTHESIESDNLPMYGKSREEFPELARCIDDISEYFSREHHTVLTDEKKLYLMLHVNRIRTSQG